MLPDFPKAKAKANLFLMRAIRARAAKSPLLSQIRNTYQHEGRRSVIRREDSSEEITEYQSMSQSLEITREEMRVWDPDRIIAKVAQIAEAVEEAQTLALFRALERAAEESGNTVAAGGKGLEKEQFLELQRKLLRSFDTQTEKPNEPTFVVHPDMMPKLKEKFAEWETDETFMKELNRIEEEKKEEWRAREASRKLVD